MRKNSPRKWLHAILDLLPCILIPVFMIYSHRHTIDSYSVTRQELQHNDFPMYQGVEYGDFLSSSNTFTHYDWDADITDSDFETGVGYTLWLDSYVDFYNLQYFDLTYEYNDYLLIYFDFEIESINFTDFSQFRLTLGDLPENEIEISINENDFINKYIVLNPSSDLSDDIAYFRFYIETNDSFEITFRTIEIFNLNQIFGTDYSNYLNEFVSLVKNGSYFNATNGTYNFELSYITDVTYNDTDIMSQFTYNLYNSVDKYFNMNNVFGMNNVYSWFETNIFHGTAPLYIYIVWNILLYEFVMDLLMLLYALFMWFIDMCQSLIDRSFNSMKGN